MKKQSRIRAVASYTFYFHHQVMQRLLLALLLATTLFYVSFQSISFDDFDSGSFALALDKFDIGLQQPHPPGFPVYIATARALRSLTGDRRTALTLLSVIS